MSLELLPPLVHKKYTDFGGRYFALSVKRSVCLPASMDILGVPVNVKVTTLFFLITKTSFITCT